MITLYLWKCLEAESIDVLLPFLTLFEISNPLIFRNFKSLEELSWAGWAKRSITLYLWQCLEAESIEVFCHYLEAVHENFPARAWNCITTTFGPMRNVIRDEPCIYRLKSRKNWLMLTPIVCDQIELMQFFFSNLLTFLSTTCVNSTHHTL